MIVLRKRRGLLLVFITNIMMVDFLKCAGQVTSATTSPPKDPWVIYTVKICEQQCEFNIEYPRSAVVQSDCKRKNPFNCRDLTMNISTVSDGRIFIHSRYSEDNLWLFVVLGTGPVLVVSLIILTIVIVVISCRRKRRRRQKEENLLHRQEDDISLSSTSPPPAYNQLQPISSTSIRGPPPKTPPKRPQLPLPLPQQKPDRPLSEMSIQSDPPHPSFSPGCTCVNGGGTVPCRQRENWLPDEAELAEAIATTLGRLRVKPTTLNINMYRSRRMSRSVPDLFTPQGKNFSLPKGRNDDFAEMEEEEEEGDHFSDTDRLTHQHSKRERHKPQKTAKKTIFSGRKDTADTAKAGKRPISSEMLPRKFIRDTSLHIRADESFFESSGNDVIEVSSSLTTRESAESTGYISMRGSGRDRLGSARNPQPEVPPPQCGISGCTRLYENLPDETSSSSSGYTYPPLPLPLFQDRMPAGAFCYTTPLLPPGPKVKATSQLDDDRSTRLSHESSTTVRIYKTGTLRKE